MSDIIDRLKFAALEIADANISGWGNVCMDAAAEIESLRAQLSTQSPSLMEAAQAVIDRWNSPAWKDAPHTAEYIANLQKALDGLSAQSPADGECKWKVYDDDNIPGTYQGQCGILWTFNDGTPEDNECHHCPKCGGRIAK